MNIFGKHVKLTLAVLGVTSLSLVVAGCSSSGSSPFDATISKTSSFIQGEMAKRNAVGLSIALVSDNKIVWTQGFGWADKENRIPATADSVYMLGSGTKALTAAALLELQEKGLISLDNPAADYLAGFTMAPRYPNQIQEMTVRRLLTHHSGVPGDLYNAGFLLGNGWDQWGCNLYMDWLMDYLSTDYPSHQPGEMATYSNTAFVLAGEIALRQGGMAGESYPDFLARELFTPLGMNTTSLGAIKKNLARGYQQGEPTQVKETNCSFGATGGAYTTVKDMARFLMMVVNEGKTLEGAQFLRPETVAMLGEAERSALDIDSLFQPGLGLDTVDDPVMRYAGRAWMKNGSTGDYNSLMEMLPDAKLGVIVLTNSDTASDLVWDVVRECLKNAVQEKLGISPSAPQLPSYASVNDPSRIAGIYAKKFGYDKITDNGDGTLAWTIDAHHPDPHTYNLTFQDGVYRDQGKSESISFRDIQWNGVDHFVMIQSGSSGSGKDESMYGGYVRTIVGEKITVPAVPSAWEARQGVYVLDNLPWDDGNMDSPFSQLRVTDGMIIWDNLNAAIPGNDTTAFLPALINRSDSSIRAVQHDGKEKLLFGGYRAYPIDLVPAVVTGDTVSGTVEIFKTDWYRFDTATSGQQVNVKVTADSDNYALTLFDENLAYLDRGMGALSFTARHGSYFIAVSPTADAGGNYAMTVNALLRGQP
jgi:CubicO group peptidase (beta-lactamase class C family)